MLYLVDLLAHRPLQVLSILDCSLPAFIISLLGRGLQGSLNLSGGREREGEKAGKDGAREVVLLLMVAGRSQRSAHGAHMERSWRHVGVVVKRLCSTWQHLTHTCLRSETSVAFKPRPSSVLTPARADDNQPTTAGESVTSVFQVHHACHLQTSRTRSFTLYAALMYT